MKITGIRTLQLADFPNLIFVEVSTDEGLVGTSDTYTRPTRSPRTFTTTPRPSCWGRTRSTWNATGTRCTPTTWPAGVGSVWSCAPVRPRRGAVGHPWPSARGADLPADRRTHPGDGSHLQHVQWADVRSQGFNRLGEGDSELDDLWAQVNAPARPRREPPRRGHHGDEDLAVRPRSRSPAACSRRPNWPRASSRSG